ncbi:MAG: HutP family protein [Synergistaceae bacterium]|nr:HutP family protein [Synergistaceae bacterium]
MEETLELHRERSNEETSGALSLDSELGIDDVGRAAVLLALTRNAEKETACKQYIEEKGWKAVATEVGGLLSDLPQKIVRALVGASLNAGVIEKNSREMHALIHAAVEASNGFIPRSLVEVSIGAKIAIVRNENWIAVAIFGDCAVHIVAHHDRCGLGVMHL